MQYYYKLLHLLFQENFCDFLAFTIKQSKCDKKIAEHFRYNAEDYKFESDYKVFQKKLENLTTDAN